MRYANNAHEPPLNFALITGVGETSPFFLFKK